MDLQLLSSLQGPLNRAGIAPWPIASRIMAHARTPCIAIDGGILIAAPEDLRGWISPEEIRFNYSSDRLHPFSLPTLREIESLTGPLRRMQWEESKFVILDWQMRDRLLQLTLGRNTTEGNTAIEAYAHHPLLHVNGRNMTLLEAYAEGAYDFFSHLPNSLTVNCVVLTSDSKALAVRRGDHLYYSPGQWEISVSEQMNADEENDCERHFFGAIERCMREELGVNQIDRIVITGLVREISNLNINAACLVHLGVTSRELIEAIKQAEDGRELSRTEFFEWSLDSAMQRLLCPEYKSVENGRNHEPLIAAGRIRLLMAMLADFTPQSVQQSLAGTPRA